MALLIRMTLIVLMLNLFLYIGINLVESSPNENGDIYRLNDELKFHFENDLLSEFLGGRSSVDEIVQSTKDNLTNYGFDYSGNLTILPEKTGGSFGGITTFIDVVDSIWKYLKTFGNIAISPLTLFFNYRMPVLIGLLIAIPYFIVFVLGIIFFVRGYSD